MSYILLRLALVAVALCISTGGLMGQQSGPDTRTSGEQTQLGGLLSRPGLLVFARHAPLGEISGTDCTVRIQAVRAWVQGAEAKSLVGLEITVSSGPATRVAILDADEVAALLNALDQIDQFMTTTRSNTSTLAEESSATFESRERFWMGVRGSAKGFLMSIGVRGVPSATCTAFAPVLKTFRQALDAGQLWFRQQ